MTNASFGHYSIVIILYDRSANCSICHCSKSFDMTIVNEAKLAKDRSDVKSNAGSDAEIEAEAEPDTIVGSIPTSDLSESDDAENENENDGNDSSLGMSGSRFHSICYLQSLSPALCFRVVWTNSLEFIFYFVFKC